jgi:glutathione transport system substrate-binding protein
MMRNRLTNVILGMALVALVTMVSAQGQITHALGIEADILDPHRYVSGGSTTPLFHIFDRLVELRIEPEVHFVPGLATSWETSEDGLRWTFHLRQGVTFHDGTLFDASSVVSNFDRILDPDEGTRAYANFASVLEDVIALDQYTVAFELKAPYAPLLNLLSVSHSSIMSPASLERYGEDVAFNPVGTGPFKFVSWVRDDRMVLEANDDYWGGRPKIDTLTFIPVIEPSTRLIMLERGEVDVIPGIPIELLDRVTNNSNLQLLNVPSSRIRLIGINTLVEPLNDVRVRQALNYAVDMVTINEVLLSGTKRLLDSPVPPSDFGYTPTFRYEYDPERARQLLAEAGYPDGFTVNFVILLQTRDAGLADVLQAMRDYWADVGIQTTVTTVEIAAYSDIVDSPPDSDVARNTKHLYAQGFNADAMDADYTLRRSFDCDNWAPFSTNRGYYCNPAVDELLDAASAEMDPDKRRELYAEAQRMIMEDAPWVFKYVEPLLFGVRADIQGVITYPQDVLLYHEAWRAE